MLRVKRQQYSPTQMQRAIQLVRDGVAKKKAASFCGVPRTTLLDKLAGRVPEEHTRMGRKTALTPAEENVVVEYINLMHKIGYPISRKQLRYEVKKILDKDARRNPFKDNLPGDEWFEGFQRRHPEVKNRKPAALGRERSIITIEMIESWYKKLHEYLEEEVEGWEAMLTDPRRTFNADESGFPLSATSGAVLAPRGARHVYQIVSNTKCQITVMACMNANGDYMPPMIIYPGQRLRDVGIDGFTDAIYATSDKGWMDSELFVRFLHEFVDYAESIGVCFPVLLFVDGHSTHVSLDAALFCQEKRIALYCLVANATHVMQPCDIGLFGPLKSAWKGELRDWHTENLGSVFTKALFPKLFKAAWTKVATVTHATQGFKRSGLFPLNPENIDQSKLTPSDLFATSSISTKSVDSVATPARANIDSSASTPATVVATPVRASVDLQTGTPPVHSIASPAPVNVDPQTTPNGQVVESVHTPVRAINLQSSNKSVENTPSNASASPSQLNNTILTPRLTPVTDIDVQNSRCSSASFVAPQASKSLPVLQSSPQSSATLPNPSELKSSASSTCISLSLPPLQRPISPTYVSPAFAGLTVPEIKTKKSVNNMRPKLPKALAGRKLIQALKEDKEKKLENQRLKEERKIERQRKKIENERLKQERKIERENKKKEREARKRSNAVSKKAKGKKGRKAQLDCETSSDDDNVAMEFDDSDPSLSDIENLPPRDCYVCRKNDNETCVQCVMCDRVLHVVCSGNLILQSLTEAELEEHEYFCDNCTFD